MDNPTLWVCRQESMPGRKLFTYKKDWRIRFKWIQRKILSERNGQPTSSVVSKLPSLVVQSSRFVRKSTNPEGYHRGGVGSSKHLVLTPERTSRCSARYLSPLASKSDRHVSFERNNERKRFPQIACLYAFIGPCKESWTFIRVVLGF